MDDFLDGAIGFVISDFGWNFGVCLAVEPVVKETVGERAAEALMEKEEQQCHFTRKVKKIVLVAALS
jgi:hypothetical protein